MEASRERGDGAPPPPRPGSMVGRTGPSSVIGSNEGWLRCPPEAGAGRGKSRVSSPRRSSGYPVRRLYPEARSGGQPSFFGKRTESRADLGYGLPRSAPWVGLLRKETFKYGPGRLPSPSGQGRGKGTRDPVGKRRWRLSLVPRACAGAVGMGLDVESSGGPGGLPPVFMFLLGFGVCDELVGGEYSTCVQV